MFTRIYGKPKPEANAVTTLDKLNEMIMLEDAKATTETVDALRTGAQARNIDDVDKTMDEINEQTENMKQIQEALSAPICAAAPTADFDEDELEAELEELEGDELEEELLQPATTSPAATVHIPAGRQPPRPSPMQNTAEEDELAALQAEMAL